MTGIQKQPFRIIEIPLNKFNDEAIPYHQKVFEQHKTTAYKLVSNNKVEQLNKEVKDKKRVVQQLKNLLYELDTLRTQVEDVSLDKFDDKTFSLRKNITFLTKGYAAIEKQAVQLSDAQNQINENIENENPFQGASQIQIQENIDDLKLQQQENRLKNVVAIEDDVQDLHGIYVELNQMVAEQASSVDIIETQVEDTQQNVNEGLRQLIKASKFKTATYPLTGALLGSLLGGPLGLVAGFKVGGIAALGCGVAGYAGGKFFKKCNEDNVAETENHVKSNEDANNFDTAIETVDKKDK